MAKFIISTDSSVDLFKSELAKKNVYYIIMKRILDGKEIGEIFDSEKQFDNFYQGIERGERPTTVAINPTEVQEHLEKIIKKEPKGDIIHVSLSSGLSVTYDNAKIAEAAVNKTLKDRKVVVFDGRVVTAVQAYTINELVRLRDEGKTIDEALEYIQRLCAEIHGWAIIDDLFHLKRGGRISGAKAVLGTILGVKPIICLNHIGKLAIESRAKGIKKAVEAMLTKIEEYGERTHKDFSTSTIYLYRTSKNKIFDSLKVAIKGKYPNIKLVEGIVGPIVGAHIGCSGTVIVYRGDKRLTVE